MKSVAIEREFGSGGRDIGIRIAKEAQIPYYDGQLLIEAAKGYGNRKCSQWKMKIKDLLIIADDFFFYHAYIMEVNRCCA